MLINQLEINISKPINWFLNGISLMKRKAGIQSFNNYGLALMWQLRSLVLVSTTTKYERRDGYSLNKWRIIPLNLIHCNESHLSLLPVIIILGFRVLVTLYLIIHATITVMSINYSAWDTKWLNKIPT